MTPNHTLASQHKRNVHATEGIIDSLERILKASELELKDLGAIAFGAGPGLFSGIRTATAIAQGLAYVHELQVAQIPSTLALAHASKCQQALVSYPAHRGHCYIAAHTKSDHNWSTILEPSLHALTDLPRLNGNWQLCARGLATMNTNFTACVSGSLTRVRAYRGNLAPAVGSLGLVAMAAGRLCDPGRRPTSVRYELK